MNLRNDEAISAGFRVCRWKEMLKRQRLDVLPSPFGSPTSIQHQLDFYSTLCNIPETNMKFLNASILTCALAVVSSTVQAAITYPWEARHGLTSVQYQNTFDSLVAQGYRLSYVSGYTINNDPRFAAVWEKKASPAWVARHGLTSAQYQAAFDTYVSQGFRPILVNGYTVNGQDRYVAIWDKSPSGAWVARHGLTSADYQSTFDSLVGQGYRLKHVSGYAVGGQARYAAIWEKTGDTSAWVARHGLTSSQYQQEFNRLVALGYRLTRVSGYGVNDVDFYAAIWEQKSGPNWVARHGLTSAGYQSEFNRLNSLGYEPKVVSGYTIGGSDRYAALWEDGPSV